MNAIAGLETQRGSPRRPAIVVAVRDGRRRWASGREPSVLEQVAAMAGAQPEAYPFFRVRACLLDADVIIRQVLASVRRGATVALIELTDRGILRSYAAIQVIGEVDRKLSAAALAAHVDPGAAYQVWSGFRSVVRHIDVQPDAVPPCPIRDAGDLPTAYLSAIVGAAWTWSYDLDLNDEDLARPYPLAVALRVRDAADREEAFYSGITVAGGMTGAFFEAGRFVVEQACRRPWLAFLFGAAVALGLERAVEHRAVLREALSEVRRAAELAARMAMEKLESYAQVVSGIAPSPPIASDLPLSIAVGRILAFAPVPLSTTEIARGLRECGFETSELDVRRALASSTIFVRTHIGRWQLGWY